MSAQPAINLLPEEIRSLALRCPVCKAALAPLDLADASAWQECLRCHFVVANQGGVWRALAPVREIYFRRFATEYSAIREREGRGAHTAEYYLGLPYRDLSGRNDWQWRIRSRSFAYFESRLLPGLEARAPRPLRVLDMGAGNGWLSYRLALRGHECIALDLLDNPLDGLGAARHYMSHLPRPFACVQAEMDNLPFAAGQFDVAIFNASFHYSEDYLRTLRETMRCLAPGGEVVILDTPYYNRDQSGRAMVLEKHESFRQQYGFRPDRLHSREYLTDDILEGLEHDSGLSWRFERPWYGLSWALRPWKALLKGRREPAKFYVISATAGGQ